MSINQYFDQEIDERLGSPQETCKFNPTLTCEQVPCENCPKRSYYLD